MYAHWTRRSLRWLRHQTIVDGWRRRWCLGTRLDWSDPLTFHRLYGRWRDGHLGLLWNRLKRETSSFVNRISWIALLSVATANDPLGGLRRRGPFAQLRWCLPVDWIDYMNRVQCEGSFEEFVPRNCLQIVRLANKLFRDATLLHRPVHIYIINSHVTLRIFNQQFIFFFFCINNLHFRFTYL